MNLLYKYAKKIILKHELISPEDFKKATSYQKKHPELSILDVLQKSKLLSPDHIKQISAGFKKYKEKKGIVENDESSEEDNHPEETINTSSIEIPQKNSNINNFNSLQDYLEYARSQKASDLHISATSIPHIRKNGRLTPLEQGPLNPKQAEEIILNALDEKNREKLLENQSLETTLVFNKKERYRSCIVKSHRGWDGSFRIIDRVVPSLESLQLPPILTKLIDFPTGLVLIVGPSGTGKSSTMAALVQLLNTKREDHIITLEDPIEYVFTSDQCHISQRQEGDHTLSFSNALRGALREDPDIIIVGEMRDFNTASLAITAAETGHLVITTLHTTSAVKTIERVIDMFPPEQISQIRAMFSKSLRAIICQKLIPKADDSGRALAIEVLFNNTAISNLIDQNKLLSIPSSIQMGKSQGMCLMDESIKQLLKEKIITDEEAAVHMTENKKSFSKSKGLK